MADPPMASFLLPKGVSTSSIATEPTTSTGVFFIFQPGFEPENYEILRLFTIW